VASESIARDSSLSVSAATIRNEMARLEEEDYITRPHISAGSTPSDKGYRYYVESLMGEIELPLGEQRTIRHLFHQAESQVEEWEHLAAAVLARRVMNIALVTVPQPPLCCLRHIELLSLREFAALLIVVLCEARVKQQLVFLDRMVSQDELTTITNKLNDYYADMTHAQIQSQDRELSSTEKRITEIILQTMHIEDEQRCGELYLEGIQHFLSQPEFSRGIGIAELLGILENRTALREFLPLADEKEGTRVIIGSENKEDALRQCSMILSAYGIPGKTTGVIGVIGPTRMHYACVISSVRYLSALMTELFDRLYGQG
jgi:heat-inducible transcriptional repressor